MILTSTSAATAFYSTKSGATFTSAPDCGGSKWLVLRIEGGQSSTLTFYYTQEEADSRAKEEAEKCG